jgi:F-type H+-transporting ATPase subunit epsilon
MTKTFTVEIITPYRVFYSGQAESVIVTSIDGELELLAEHEPVVTPIAIGSVRIKTEGAWKTASFSDGFLEMEKNHLNVLVGAAEWPEEIDVERAERSLKRATERLEDKTMPWETKRATLALHRAQSRLRIAMLSKKEES